MTERQLRYRLRKQGYLLNKREDGYMIVDGDTNMVIAGGYPTAFNLSLSDVIAWVAESP